MCMNKGTNNPCCCAFSIIGALLAAVGIAGIFYAGLITAIIPLIYVTLVLGILVLLYAFITAFCGGKHSCAALDSCLISAAVRLNYHKCFCFSSNNSTCCFSYSRYINRCCCLFPSVKLI